MLRWESMGQHDPPGSSERVSNEPSVVGLTTAYPLRPDVYVSICLPSAADDMMGQCRTGSHNTDLF